MSDLLASVSPLIRYLIFLYLEGIGFETTKKSHYERKGTSVGLERLVHNLKRRSFAAPFSSTNKLWLEYLPLREATRDFFHLREARYQENFLCSLFFVLVAG